MFHVEHSPNTPPAPAHAAEAVELPRRRHWLIRAVVAVAILVVLAFFGMRYRSDLWRLREVSPLLVAAIALLWLLTRYLAADVMRIALRALGHRIGRYEAFMLQMVQSYGNTLVPRAGIGAPAVYLKLRHGTPFADLGAVQLLPMTLLQIFTIGVMGLGCQLVLWRFYGLPWERPLLPASLERKRLSPPSLISLPPTFFRKGMVPPGRTGKSAMLTTVSTRGNVIRQRSTISMARLGIRTIRVGKTETIPTS